MKDDGKEFSTEGQQAGLPMTRAKAASVKKV